MAFVAILAVSVSVTADDASVVSGGIPVSSISTGAWKGVKGVVLEVLKVTSGTGDAAFTGSGSGVADF